MFGEEARFDTFVSHEATFLIRFLEPFRFFYEIASL